MRIRQARLADTVAIITGASRGLGQLCALAYASEGAKVAIIGRNATESPMRLPGNVYQTAAAVEELTGGSALPIVCDVADRAEVQRMVGEVLERWDRVDVLLNNAAFVTAEGEGAASVPVQLFERMLRVNVLGAFEVIRAVLPAMRRQSRGNIINVSGRSRTHGSPLEVTKTALETLTAGLASELRSFGVACNALRPAGFIDTPGALLNREVKPRDFMPPNSYLEAAVLLAAQTAASYTGQIKTDAEVIRDLADEPTWEHFRELNPPGWSEVPARSADRARDYLLPAAGSAGSHQQETT
jgi:NAD(P)-dependent dehydrogenase (short-subunit alcohol dehydrogenase family)